MYGRKSVILIIITCLASVIRRTLHCWEPNATASSIPHRKLRNAYGGRPFPKGGVRLRRVSLPAAVSRPAAPIPIRPIQTFLHPDAALQKSDHHKGKDLRHLKQLAAVDRDPNRADCVFSRRALQLWSAEYDRGAFYCIRMKAKCGVGADASPYGPPLGRTAPPSPPKRRKRGRIPY